MGSSRKRKPSESEETSSSSDSEENLKKKRKKKEKGKRSKHKHVSSSDSSSSTDTSSDSSSSSSEEERKRRRRKEKKKKKKAKLKSKNKKIKKDKGNEKGKIDTNEGSTDVPLELMDRAKTLAPMTKEQWEKQQSVVRKVYDESTGRHRLIKGDGEVIEEIVSRDRHKAINKQATSGDGNFFHKTLYSKSTTK